ncbi:MAG: aldehyde ferredoxin oxidoreductase C-terminal domain-containing protein [Syntrophaceae bacterium]
MNFSKAKLVRGYTNKLLNVNLDTGSMESADLDPEIRDFFIGGRSLGLYLLHKSTTLNTLPGDPDNALILSPGPLGGIPQFPGTSKCMAVALSPLTGIPGVSNFGGHFGAYLKYAGFDALTIAGKSKKEVMLVIDSFRGEAWIEEFAAADHVFDMEKRIAEKFTAMGYQKKDIVFLTTGSGAKRTKYGCINSHYYDATKPAEGAKGLFRVKQAGRTGLGTVMIGKNLRAVVVVAEFPRGENPYGAADWEKVKAAGSKLHSVVKEVDPQSLKMYRKGSAGLIAFMNKDDYQSLPVHNYQFGSHPQAEKITGKYYAEHLFEHRGMDGCFPGCNLRCTKGGWVTLNSGRLRGNKVWVDGPEYETAAGFGSNLGMWNAEFIMEANWLCDDYGIDTITVAVIMAFLMECFQRGYLDREDAGGLELAWGNEEAALTFIHQVARGETEMAREAGKGMTALVDWVSRKHAKKTGKRIRQELLKFAMQAKGLPFSLYRTHRSLSMQASYAAASDIGAHHAAAWLIKADLLGAFPTFKAKAQALITYPRVRLGNDNLGLCKLPWVDVFNPESQKVTNSDVYINPASQKLYADFYNGVIGTDMTWEEIFVQTDRDINLQRVMNSMVFGSETGANDWIPERAIGPIDDKLYEAERDFHDGQLSATLNKPLAEVQTMETSKKRELLMDARKAQLDSLIQAYYHERGWSPQGLPEIETLKRIGLWKFLRGETRLRMQELHETKKQAVK